MSVEWEVFLVLLSASILVVYLTSQRRAIPSALSLLVISLLFAAIILYIREGFGWYFTTIDESYYVSLLSNPLWYKTSIVSGYITPFSLHALSPLFPTPVEEVVWYSAITGVIYALSIFLIYKVLGFSSQHSLLSVLILFMTPLYIWSVIQIRPQQVGLLVGLFATALFVRMKPTKRFFLIMPSLYILLIFSHVLSFILYSLLLITYISVRAITVEHGEYLRKYPVLAISVVLSWIIFLAFPYSGPILRNMTWLFDSLLHISVASHAFLILSTGGITALLLGWYMVLHYLSGYFSGAHINLNIVIKEGMHIYHRAGRRFLALMGLLAILAVAYIQFRLGASVYMRVYQGSLVTLLLFQMGNLVFALLYLRGLFLNLERGQISDFELLSLLILLIASGFLIISFFMPPGNGIWGFRNWFIRALQYFVPLAAPVVGRQIMDDINSLKVNWQRLLISVFLALIIMISVLNTARVPGVYNYGAVWNHELVSLCNEFKGVYTPRDKLSIYSRFVENNLIKACGNKLSIGKTDRLMVSSDGFYISSYPYFSITIGEFGRDLIKDGNRTVVIFGGNVLRNLYIASLIKKALFIHVRHGGRCPLETARFRYPLLLIGGSASNPCTSAIEKTGTLDVKLSANYVITPRSTYAVPSSNPWWNATEGLFVIYSLRYDNVPVLLVEGTNLDATLAGVYYLMTTVYPRVEDYSNAHYIVGKWMETDGTVIDAAKGVPKDTNGFSPKDRILVLEVG